MIRKAALLLCFAVAGCQSHHYVVVRGPAPLYETPTSEVAVAHLPRYHHEPIPDPVVRGERVRVRYDGRYGFVSRETVRLFTYLDPLVDGGDERDDEVAANLREAQLDNMGGKWSAAVKSAIRGERVVEGMTRHQVELAWGWPLTVQPGKLPEGERWVYRFERSETIRQFLSDPWSCPSSYSPYLPSDGWGMSRPLLRRGWVHRRLPVTEERVVELDAEGRVAHVSVRRFLAND